MVPVPTTRAGGRPETSVITRVRTSTGLVTMTIVPRQPLSFPAMSLTTAAFSRSSSSRVSPGRPPRPAATTTASASAMSSIGAGRTLADG